MCVYVREYGVCMYVCTCLQHNSDRHPRKVPVGTHQEDDIGMLVESSGHADPLALTTRQVDALSPKGGHLDSTDLQEGFSLLLLDILVPPPHCLLPLQSEET